MALLLVKDVANSKLKELECTSAGLLKVDHVDVSALATESSLSAMDAKISACDTGNISGVVAVSAVSGDVACTHASLPLPTGAATESSLATVAGCVTGSVLAVSSSVAAISATSVYVFGSQGSPQSELSNLDATSSVVDIDAYSKVLIAGSTTKLDAEFQVEVSSDNLDWFDLQDKFVNVDYATGNFGLIMDTPFKYIRLKRLADAGDSGSDSLSCIISGK
tara:strand:- start:1096 stop:1758 length:663 start_codon:yes stop_codon:yes gene_type:complete